MINWDGTEIKSRLFKMKGVKRTAGVLNFSTLVYILVTYLKFAIIKVVH